MVLIFLLVAVDSYGRSHSALFQRMSITGEFSGQACEGRGMSTGFEARDRGPIIRIFFR